MTSIQKKENTLEPSGVHVVQAVLGCEHFDAGQWLQVNYDHKRIDRDGLYLINDGGSTTVRRIEDSVIHGWRVRIGEHLVPLHQCVNFRVLGLVNLVHGEGV
ncbi:MAG TPA: hypothetical protein VIC30_07020 [Orrella sp.]